MMDWNALLRKHADVIAGLVVWQIVAQYLGPRTSPDWGIVTLVVPIAFGVGAYLLVQRVWPETRA